MKEQFEMGEEKRVTERAPCCRQSSEGWQTQEAANGRRTLALPFLLYANE
jgi:hypothetical protein